MVSHASGRPPPACLYLGPYLGTIAGPGLSDRVLATRKGLVSMTTATASQKKGFQIPIIPGGLMAAIIQGILLVMIPRSGITVRKDGENEICEGTATLPASSTGKTALIASTGGFREIDVLDDKGVPVLFDGKPLKLNLSAYVPLATPTSKIVDDTTASGKFNFNVDPNAPVSAALTKEVLVLGLPASVVPEPVKEGGKMRRVAGGGSNLTLDVTVGGQQVRCNVYAGIRA